jgi:hypothetical protein
MRDDVTSLAKTQETSMTHDTTTSGIKHYLNPKAFFPDFLYSDGVHFYARSLRQPWKICFGILSYAWESLKASLVEKGVGVGDHAYAWIPSSLLQLSPQGPRERHPTAYCSNRSGWTRLDLLCAFSACGLHSRVSRAAILKEQVPINTFSI